MPLVAIPAGKPIPNINYSNLGCCQYQTELSWGTERADRTRKSDLFDTPLSEISSFTSDIYVTDSKLHY